MKAPHSNDIQFWEGRYDLPLQVGLLVRVSEESDHYAEFALEPSNAHMVVKIEVDEDGMKIGINATGEDQDYQSLPYEFRANEIEPIFGVNANKRQKANYG